MHICIDSCVFIRGVRTGDEAIIRILDGISANLILLIPRLIAQEVSRNLETVEQVRQFYRLFHSFEYAHIIDEPVPRDLVEKYSSLGLPAKADAFIGAFAEWQQIQYLISDNRHFLERLQTPAFRVITPIQFIEHL
jgi:hypothetical protein